MVVLREVLRDKILRGILVVLVLLVLGVFLFVQGGCARHVGRYTTKEGLTVELSSTRFIMGQEVNGFTATFPGGYKIGFDTSKSEADKTLSNFINMVGPMVQYYSQQKTLPGVIP